MDSGTKEMHASSQSRREDNSCHSFLGGRRVMELRWFQDGMKTFPCLGEFYGKIKNYE